MLCNQCKTKAEFQCCSSIFCSIHFNQHFKKAKSHNPSSLTLKLDETENYVLNRNLDYSIKSLKILKKRAIIENKQIIKVLTSILNSTLIKINDLIKHFNDLKTSQEFYTYDMDEIKKHIRSETSYKLKNSYESIENIKNLFAMEIFVSDPDIQRKIIQKKFLETHNGGFMCIGISSDGKNLVTGSEDSTVRLWDVVTGKQIIYLTGHKSEVRCLALLSDFSLAVSGSADRTLIVWDMRNYRLIKTLYGHCGIVCAIIFSEDEKFILSGGCECEMFIWRLNTLNVSTKYQLLVLFGH